MNAQELVHGPKFAEGGVDGALGGSAILVVDSY